MKDSKDVPGAKNAALTASDREFMLAKFGVPLDAIELDEVQVSFALATRRIKELESEALGRLRKR